MALRKPSKQGSEAGPVDNDQQRERCVLCGADTGYFFSTPVNERQFYVEGAGQMCRACYQDLYKRNDSSG